MAVKLLPALYMVVLLLAESLNREAAKSPSSTLRYAGLVWSEQGPTQPEGRIGQKASGSGPVDKLKILEPVLFTLPLHQPKVELCSMTLTPDTSIANTTSC